MTTNIVHAILRFPHVVAVPIEHVWEAYADLDQRLRWGVPAGDEIVYDEANFSSGGQDHYRCGPPGDLSNLGTHTYHQIAPQRQIVYTDTVRRQDTVLSTALLTWQFEPVDQHRSRITVTDLVASFVGQGILDGHRNGHQRTLNQLDSFLVGRDQFPAVTTSGQQMGPGDAWA